MSSLAFVACDINAFSAADGAHGEPAGAEESVHCNEPYAIEAAALPGMKGRAFLYGATATGLTKAPPLASFAHGGAFWFFLETEADPDVELRVVVSGDLTRTDDSTGACWSYAGRAATHLQIVAQEEGQGTIEVFVDGAPYDRFELSIRQPTSLAIEWQPELSRGTAHLHDAHGEPLFAVRGITWEVAPSSSPALTEGVDGPFLMWDGGIGEVRYLAFFGELSASLRLVVDPATGLFTETAR